MSTTTDQAPERQHSAGGLVVRGDQILLIQTAEGDRWQLPKGRLERSETAAQAALREIYEETGIYGRTRAFLGTVKFRFSVDGQPIDKRVDYYLVEYEGGSATNYNRKEVATARWFSWREGIARITFDNERALVEKACASFAPNDET